MLVAGVMILRQPDAGVVTFGGLFLINGFTAFAKLLTLGGAMLTLVMVNTWAQGAGTARFEIPVLARVKDKWSKVEVRPDDGGPPVGITDGRVRVREFPFVVMTSNGERDFPQPFLRRCIRMHIDQPDANKLGKIISEHLDEEALKSARNIIEDFHVRAHKGDVANDQCRWFPGPPAIDPLV